MPWSKLANDPAITSAKLATGAVTYEKLAVGATSATYVTTLPSSPADGREVYFAANATDSIIWHLRWRTAASAWEFVGGSKLRGAYSGAYYPSGGWQAFINITLPSTGTFDVSYSGQTQINASTSLYLGVSVAGSTPAGGFYTQVANGTGSHWYGMPQAGACRVTGTASQVVSLTVNSPVGAVYSAEMTIVPVKVTG